MGVGRDVNFNPQGWGNSDDWDNVTVTVLGTKGSQVRLGVNAPRDVSVHREEIYERIQKEKEVGEQSR